MFSFTTTSGHSFGGITTSLVSSNVTPSCITSGL